MARRGFSGAVMRIMQVRDHQATVVSREMLAPKFVRVHLRSDTFFDQAEYVPTAWLRGWFPDPSGRNIEHQRGYTLSSAVPERGEFSLDFVLHEPAGPASAWAQHCTPGDSISVSTLGSSKFELPSSPSERPPGYLLVGDAAAIPGLASIITAVPKDLEIELYLEEHDPDDRHIPLPQHPRLRTTWVPRRDADSLAAAIETRARAGWHAWVTTESASLKRLRPRLRDELGFAKADTHAQAYWIEHREMGKQRENAATHTS